MSMTPEEERDVLVDRYVNGKLTEEERAEFEVRMMDETGLFEQFQTTDGLKKALCNYATQLRQNEVGQYPTSILPLKHWLRQPLSLAASALFVTTVGLLIQSKVTQLPTRLLPINGVMLLEASRGINALTVASNPPYLLQIDADVGNGTEDFSVALLDSADQIVFEQQGIHADGDAWVRVVATQRLSGQFTVVLSWLDSGREPQSRSFQVLFAPE